MTTTYRPSKFRQGRKRPGYWQSGFSLVEVVIATGLCTYVLVIIACLLPMGLGTVQAANAQIVQTEIFNRLQLEVNTVPYYALPSYSRFNGGTFPDGKPNGTGLSFFDKDGGEIAGAAAETAAATAGAAPPAGTVYYVYCTLISSNASTTTMPGNADSTLVNRLAALDPPVDGLGNSNKQANAAGSMGAGVTLVRIDIGFHYSPTNLTAPDQTDSRVSSRTFVITKRDTYDGS